MTFDQARRGQPDLLDMAILHSRKTHMSTRSMGKNSQAQSAHMRQLPGLCTTLWEGTHTCAGL